MLALATEPERIALFPAFAAVCRILILLPLGTAGVERSFSTLNRILCSERCRLSPEHTDQLMNISVEGPPLPDLRDDQTDEQNNSVTLSSLAEKAVNVWLSSKDRRL